MKKMSDLISRKALIESYCEENCGERRCRDAWDRCMFVSHVLEQPSVTDTNVGGKWIPCSERLPENNGNYMTCDEKGNIHIFWYDDCQKCPFNISEYHTRYYPVVAWMPLPEPYKGE